MRPGSGNGFVRQNGKQTLPLPKLCAIISSYRSAVHIGLIYYMGFVMLVSNQILNWYSR